MLDVIRDVLQSLPRVSLIVGILALIFGIIIMIFPKILNYLVGIFLILCGAVALLYYFFT